MIELHSSSFSNQAEIDRYFMEQAYQLALKGKVSCYPNPAVGCIIVKDLQILGQGYHQFAGKNHAEINALEDLIANYPDNYPELLKQATVYVTLEPCSHWGRTPPCANRLASYTVKRVVIGGRDLTNHANGRGVKILEDAGIEVDFCLLEEIDKLNRDFNYLHTQAQQSELPFVRLKIGASIDSRTALPNGESKWITNAESRSYVQKLRHDTQAVLCTAKTVTIDDAKYNVRYEQLPKAIKDHLTPEQVKQPKVFVIDNSFLFSGNEQIFTPEFNNWVVIFSKEPHPLRTSLSLVNSTSSLESTSLPSSPKATSSILQQAQVYSYHYDSESKALVIDCRMNDGRVTDDRVNADRVNTDRANEDGDKSVKENLFQSLESSALQKTIVFISGVDSHSDQGLTELLALIKIEFKVKDLLVEAGSTFSQSILSYGLYNELHYGIGPKILGQGNSALRTIQEFTHVSQVPEFEMGYYYVFGNDFYIVYLPVTKAS